MTLALGRRAAATLHTPLPLALLALALTLAGCGMDGGGQKGNVLARYEIRRGELVIAIKESASLRSRQPAFIKGQEGKVAWVIPEGTSVKAGDKLLEIANDNLVRQVDDARLALEKVGREAEAAIADLKLYELESAKLVEDDARGVDASRMNLEQYRDGKAPLRQDELKLLAERAEIDAKDAQEKYELMPDLYAKNFITRADLRTAELDTREKSQRHKKAQREYEIFVSFENPVELAKLEAEAKAAVVKVERTRQTIATQRAEKEAAVRVKAHERERGAEMVAKLNKSLVELTVTAPRDGIVVYGSTSRRPWEQVESLEPGSDVDQNRIVMTIPNLSDMVAVTRVDQVNVGNVAPGMPATTRVDGLDAPLSGEVLKVGSTATYDGIGGSAYETEVSLIGGGDSFRSGMTAKVEIVLKRLPDVLLIPIDAVYQRDGKTFCYVQGGGRREIEIGQSNAGHAVVLKGLEAGETVEVYAVEPGG